MADCPKCHAYTEIPEQSYGTLFTCPTCSAVYFVDWSGNPEVPAETENPSPSFETGPISSIGSDRDSFPPASEKLNFAPEENSYSEAFQIKEAPLESTASEGGMEVYTPEPEPPTNPIGETDGFSAPLIESAIKVSGTPDFKEVVDFGNELQGNQIFHYDVTVRGIEIAETRAKFREALDDSRFGWDVDVQMQNIVDGSIVFHDLSPAKAGVLINRIKYLGLDVSWKQKVLS